MGIPAEDYFGPVYQQDIQHLTRISTTSAVNLNPEPLHPKPLNPNSILGYKKGLGFRDTPNNGESNEQENGT